MGAFAIFSLLDPPLLQGPYGLSWMRAGFRFRPCYLPGWVTGGGHMASLYLGFCLCQLWMMTPLTLTVTGKPFLFSRKQAGSVSSTISKCPGLGKILQEADICISFACICIRNAVAPLCIQMTGPGVRELLLRTSFAEPHECHRRATPRERLALSTLTPGATLLDSLGDGLPVPPGHSHSPPFLLQA